MSYPVRPEQVQDAWVRGKVEMFIKTVELRNKDPRLVGVDAITALYQEVKGHCTLDTKLTVKIKREEMTE